MNEMPRLNEMPRNLEAFVPGRPAPQGSKRYLGPGRIVEMSPYLHAWRDDVRSTLMRGWAGQPPMAGAVNIVLNFVLPRPASAPKRWTPPAVKRPDLDKLMRGVCDAMTAAGVYRDDSQIVGAFVSKRLAEPDEMTGCHISVSELVRIKAPQRNKVTRKMTDGKG